MNMLVWSSSKKTTDTHFAALAASDCGVIVHAPATRAVVEDRRARHYALICPGWACTNGIAWSRLAKCSFEGVDNPFVENFEQRSLEFMDRNKNPIITPGLDSLEIFFIDRLHTLHQGVIKNYVGFVFQHRHRKDIFEVGSASLAART